MLRLMLKLSMEIRLSVDGYLRAEQEGKRAGGRERAMNADRYVTKLVFRSILKCDCVFVK